MMMMRIPQLPDSPTVAAKRPLIENKLGPSQNIEIKKEV